RVQPVDLADVVLQAGRDHQHLDGGARRRVVGLRADDAATLGRSRSWFVRLVLPAHGRPAFGCLLLRPFAGRGRGLFDGPGFAVPHQRQVRLPALDRTEGEPRALLRAGRNTADVVRGREVDLLLAAAAAFP